MDELRRHARIPTIRKGGDYDCIVRRVGIAAVVRIADVSSLRLLGGRGVIVLSRLRVAVEGGLRCQMVQGEYIREDIRTVAGTIGTTGRVAFAGGERATSIAKREDGRGYAVELASSTALGGGDGA